MDIFESCRSINNLLASGESAAARSELIKLLARISDSSDGLAYTALLNTLIRGVGLYPYMDMPTTDWQGRFVHEVFKADVGGTEPVTLHLEQRRLLELLMEGKSLAVSAPTSFGKSFVIDAFIAMRRPSNVVVLVPTIALADETRRRLQKKFGREYKIITTGDQELAERNILVLPQERSIGYAAKLGELDILIVDEFYKASKAFDEERAPALIRSIVEFGRLAKQRYYLAPNINDLAEGPFTAGMEFVKLDFNTVFLEKTELYLEIGKDDAKKSAALLKILRDNDGKTLIYAGTYANIEQVANLLVETFLESESSLLIEFHAWLAKHYELNWDLTYLVAKGVGVHNGTLHRSLSQIQVKLFEEPLGLNQLISTSSIIEGVNTSAKNVILWSNKNGKASLKDFAYKNIIGRGGRMFRHFVGRIFVLEKPPAEESTQLHLDYPDELLGLLDEDRVPREYTPEQVAKIRQYEVEMLELFDEEDLAFFRRSDALFTSDTETVLTIAKAMRSSPKTWNGLRFLNSDDVEKWDRLLYQLVKLNPGMWEASYTQYVGFVKILSQNWQKTIPELLDDLSIYNVGIDQFFKLERNTTFRLAALLSDVQTIYNRMNKGDPVDLSVAVARFSHAFLPKVVYQLEEYGLPRMISRKISRSGMIDLENATDIYLAIELFRHIGLHGILRSLNELDGFDHYILRYFFEGLSLQESELGELARQ